MRLQGGPPGRSQPTLPPVRALPLRSRREPAAGYGLWPDTLRLHIDAGQPAGREPSARPLLLIQIDHVVALSDAWQKGARGWDGAGVGGQQW